MSASMNADPDLAVLREDLAVLKRDVANLIEHIKGGATNFRTPPTKLIGACGTSANKRERKASARPRQSASSSKSSPLSL